MKGTSLTKPLLTASKARIEIRRRRENEIISVFIVKKISVSRQSNIEEGGCWCSAAARLNRDDTDSDETCCPVGYISTDVAS